MVALGVTVTGVVLVTVPTPVSMLPVPPLNTAVSWVLSPILMLVGLATKLVMTGGGPPVTLTVACAVTTHPGSRAVYRESIGGGYGGLDRHGGGARDGAHALVDGALPAAEHGGELGAAPATILVGLATKLVMTGAGPPVTLTAVWDVTVPPVPLLTVRV